MKNLIDLNHLLKAAGMVIAERLSKTKILKQEEKQKQWSSMVEKYQGWKQVSRNGDGMEVN